MADFIKIKPITTGKPHAVAVRTIAHIEASHDPKSSAAKSLIIFNDDARLLVFETLDELLALARG